MERNPDHDHHNTDNVQEFLQMAVNNKRTHGKMVAEEGAGDNFHTPDLSSSTTDPPPPPSKKIIKNAASAIQLSSLPPQTSLPHQELQLHHHHHAAASLPSAPPVRSPQLTPVSSAPLPRPPLLRFQTPSAPPVRIPQLTPELSPPPSRPPLLRFHAFLPPTQQDFEFLLPLHKTLHDWSIMPRAPPEQTFYGASRPPPAATSRPDSLPMRRSSRRPPVPQTSLSQRGFQPYNQNLDDDDDALPIPAPLRLFPSHPMLSVTPPPTEQPSYEATHARLLSGKSAPSPRPQMSQQEEEISQPHKTLGGGAHTISTQLQLSPSHPIPASVTAAIPLPPEKSLSTAPQLSSRPPRTLPHRQEFQPHDPTLEDKYTIPSPFRLSPSHPILNATPKPPERPPQPPLRVQQGIQLLQTLDDGYSIPSPLRLSPSHPILAAATPPRPERCPPTTNHIEKKTDGTPSDRRE